jgi:hypothetical protein
MALIDGLRRIRAMQALGQEEIESFVTGEFMEVLPHLRSVNDTEDFAYPLSKRWFDYRSQREEVAKLGEQMRRRLQSEAQKGLTTGNRQWGGMQTTWRFMYRSMVGTSENTYHELVRAQAMAKQMKPGDEQFVNGVMDAMKCGDMNPNGALYQLERFMMTGDIITATDQRATMSLLIPALEGAVKGFKSLAPFHEAITDEEKREWATALRKLRRDLDQMVRNIERRISK